MDLNLMINDSLSQLKKEGYVEKIVKAQLEETIKSVIKDSLRSWSDFGKELEESVKRQLNINLKELDIPSYNHMIINTIKEELDRSMVDEGVKKIQSQIQELLGTSKHEYKLSEVIKEMMEDNDLLEDLGYDEYHEISLHIDPSYLSGKDVPYITFIHFDAEPDLSKYECKYKLVLDGDGIVTPATVKEVNFTNTTIMGNLYGIDKLIFQIYTRGSKVIVDDVETEFRNPEYD